MYYYKIGIPYLKPEELHDRVKTSTFCNWFIINNHLDIHDNLASRLYIDGYRPLGYWDQHCYEEKNLQSFFLTAVTTDLLSLDMPAQRDFEIVLDQIDLRSTQALFRKGEVAIENNLYPTDYNYAGWAALACSEQRRLFATYHLTESILDSEFKILTWLYYRYYGDHYIIKT